jgi:hypothetical protein
MAEASFDSQMAGRPIGRIANRGSYISAERSSDQLRDQRPEASQKAKGGLLARLKATNARRALFFCACVGMSLANNVSGRKNSRREVCGPAQRLQAGVRQRDTGAHPTPTLDFFRAISAGECLLVSTVALCGPKLNSLTPLGSVVLPLLKLLCSAPRLLPYIMKSCAPSVCTALP